MAVREYIGARYVPRFMGTYDPTQQYEALDVVDNGSGTSYISKTNTPPGIPLTNTTYWALYGASSGAIINLQNRVGDLETKVNRKFIFFGDSYGENYTYMGTPITGWLDRIDGIMGITKSPDSFAGSGYGFTGTGGLSWASYIAGLTSDDDITDVVFVGGTNDCPHPDATVLQDIVDTITLARTKYQNAQRIWIGYCSVGANYDPDTQNRLHELGIYARGACLNGAVFMPDLPYCLLDFRLIGANRHPNNDGTEHMAAAISSVLQYGAYYNITGRTAINITQDAQCEPNTLAGSPYFSINGNVLSVLFKGETLTNRTKIEFTTPVDVVADALPGSKLVLGKMSQLPIQTGKETLGTFPGIAVWTTGKVRNTGITLTVEDGYLCMYLTDTDDNHGAYYNTTHIDTLVSVRFPTVCFRVELIIDGQN